MTSVSSIISGASSQLSGMKQAMFRSIDSNGDGKLNKAEFVAGKPKGVSDAQASTMFDKLDTSGSGSITQAQLEDGMKKNSPVGGGAPGKISDDMLAAILQLGQQTETSSTGGLTQGAKNDDDIFAKIDTDANGKVSKKEFLATRPEGISEDMASAMFDKLDKNGKGELTQDEMESAMKGVGGEPPQLTKSGSNSSEELLTLMKALESYSSKSVASGFNPTKSLLAA